MSDAPHPKTGSLWARIMGLNEQDEATPPDASPPRNEDNSPPETVSSEASAENEPTAEAIEAIDAEVEPGMVIEECIVVESNDVEPSEDHDSVPLAEPLESTDPNPTVKFQNVSPPVPAFALNPLDDAPMGGGVLPPRMDDRELPLATPVTSPPNVPTVKPVGPPLASPILATPVLAAAPALVAGPTASPTAAAVALPPCQSCGAVRKPGLTYCDDCGYLFPTGAAAMAMPVAMAVNGEPATANSEPSATAGSSLRIKGRYLLGQLLSEKLGVSRYRGLDAGSEPSVPVVIVKATIDEDPVAEAVETVAMPVDDELLPTFDADLSGFDTPAPTVPMAEIQAMLAWPRPSWEGALLDDLKLPALPAVLDRFTENGADYLILESPTGQSLWDAWDDPDGTATLRYGYLIQIAETLDALHKAGVMVECLCPDHLVVDDGKVRFADIGDLLPLPIPPGAPLRGNLYTPPELISSPESADARASLYSFGAVLYSLEYLHHGLEEKDFEGKYTPKQITDRFPDVHPLFPRLINKTFVKDVHSRFPSDEASRIDATGFQELIQTLKVCQRVFDSVRLDVAAWTTTGMVRTGNEDAFAFLHGVDSRLDDIFEYSLILLCDGMGGYDAGEVAAAMAIQKMKEFFLQQPMFAGLAGKEPFPGPVDVEAAKKVFEAGVRHANKEVFTASRTPGKGKRGMGCTAEAVYVDPHHIIVGHVGDSRTYHLKDGRLIQLTRDHTLVNRLVELGQISEDEAEHHPRKNELQQAIGGHPDVNPGVYHSRLKRGDWVIVCSDGLTNHINNKELEKMLTREASNSSEEAARRLLNLVNLRGATDNATIVVIRAT